MTLKTGVMAAENYFFHHKKKKQIFNSYLKL